MEQFALSEIQAQAILDMRLQRLTGLEQEKILEDYASVLQDIERLRGILADDSQVFDIIKEELTDIQTAYGDDRRTEIVQATQEITYEDMIVEEDMVVTISRSGYIKRNPITLYQSQRRGGPQGHTGRAFGRQGNRTRRQGGRARSPIHPQSAAPHHRTRLRR